MKKFEKKKFDVAIIGGGFYGSVIALYLKEKFKKVVIFEREKDLLLRASYNNQARIHNGYHYPRSFMTALRSNANYSRFIFDFKEAVVDKYLMIYAIASKNSKISSHQFIRFCRQIGSSVAVAPLGIKKLFNESLIEDVFIVEEKVFNAAKLRIILKNKLLLNKIKTNYKKEVIRVKPKKDSIALEFSNGDVVKSTIVINCTYSNINQILTNSSLPSIPLKHEFAEMPLVKLPKELSKMGFTIMDGPFFSIMPFPDKRMHTIHHVRYTPSNLNKSVYLYMIKDAERYIPLLKKAKYKASMYETKTILLKNEITDARPILFKKDYGIKNFHVILGGKIDNIYDIVEELDKII